MCNGIIAKKVGMSRVFHPETGDAVAVTYLKVEPNTVIRIKTKEKDGYDAVVLGVSPKQWRTRKGKTHTRYRDQKEWKVETIEGLAPGKTLSVEKFTAESKVQITGISKGKGFQGVMKRHGFAGGPGSHGSHFKREPGSVGMRTEPGRILKGKRMAGRMGLQTVTLRNREVMVCDLENSVIGVKGPIPGHIGATIYVTLESTPVTK